MCRKGPENRGAGVEDGSSSPGREQRGPLVEALSRSWGREEGCMESVPQGVLGVAVGGEGIMALCYTYPHLPPGGEAFDYKGRARWGGWASR